MFQSIVLIILFEAQIIPSLVCGRHFKLALSCVLLTKCCWSLITSLVSDTTRFFLYISSPDLELAKSQIWGSFSEKCDLDTTVWMLGVFVATGFDFVLVCFQWTELGNMYFFKRKTIMSLYYYLQLKFRIKRLLHTYSLSFLPPLSS